MRITDLIHLKRVLGSIPGAMYRLLDAWDTGQCTLRVCKLVITTKGERICLEII